MRIAADYDGALAALSRRWPDVLVSDIGLPGRDGYELVREVRQLEQRARRRAPARDRAHRLRPRPRTGARRWRPASTCTWASRCKPHLLLRGDRGHPPAALGRQSALNPRGASMPATAGRGLPPRMVTSM